MPLNEIGTGTASSFKVLAVANQDGSVAYYQLQAPDGTIMCDRGGEPVQFLSPDKAYKQGSLMYGRKLQT